VLDQALDDFTGVDLRSVALDGVSLEGIQWSARTRWPAEWMGQVKAASREVEPGIFQIGDWEHERYEAAT
jgi:hypothetical protein